jgi:glycosyltransferase involved in cell wall biosynthesis
VHSMREPARIGLDATNIGISQTGVGNYVSTLLNAIRELKPGTSFFLYSNRQIEGVGGVELRTSTPFRRGVLWQETQLAKMVRDDNLDVFWGTNGFLPTFIKLNCPTVLTVHDLVHRFAPDTQERMVLWSRRMFQPRSCRAATRVIAVSSATARDIERCYGVPVHAVIHPQISSRFGRISDDEIKRVSDKYALPQQFLLTVGTLEPRKNIATLVEAYLDCLNGGLRVPQLVLAGGAGWLNSTIERTLEDAERSGRIRRLGFIASGDLPALYAACSAFIMPSVYEGYGMPITEAQFCGARVLHGNHPSMIEASAGLGYAFEPTRGGMSEMLTHVAAGAIRLEQRQVTEMERSPIPAAQMLWNVICDAYSARRCSRSI